MRCRQAKSVKAGNSKAAACYKDIKKTGDDTTAPSPIYANVIGGFYIFPPSKELFIAGGLLLYQNDTVSTLVAEIELDAVYSIAIWYIQVLAAVLCNIVIGSRVIIGTAP